MTGTDTNMYMNMDMVSGHGRIGTWSRSRSDRNMDTSWDRDMDTSWDRDIDLDMGAPTIASRSLPILEG